jgi:hypothetical protein
LQLVHHVAHGQWSVLHFVLFSPLPDKLPSEQRKKNPERVAAGLKASIHNPHVSKEAKESAAEKLQQLEKQQPSSQPESSGHVLGVYQCLPAILRA